VEYNLPSFLNREDTDPKIYLEDAVEIMRQVAIALNFLLNSPVLEAPVVHGHLSPNNILVSIEENDKLRVKIADAGLAHTVQRSFDLIATVNDERSRYIAPELVGNICNKNVIYSPAVDIFSLGMILLEMCIGRPSQRIQRNQQGIFFC
jgi:serine/threonine protein kinase